MQSKQRPIAPDRAQAAPGRGSRHTRTGRAAAGQPTGSGQPVESPVALVLSGLEAIRDWQERESTTLQRHPELSDQEIDTAGRAASVLRAAGFDVHDHVGTTGVVGVLENGPGPVVPMRADMDGLPMKEETGRANLLMIVPAVISIVLLVPKRRSSERVRVA